MKKNITDSAKLSPRKPKVDDYIYCHECSHIDLCENFPFNGDEEEWKERRCPSCYSDDGINLSCLPSCENCRDFVGLGECRTCPMPKHDSQKMKNGR